MKTTAVALLIFASSLVFASGKNELQIHFMDAGQGDSALIISPGGETVLVDATDRKPAKLVVAYLDQLGLTNLDYFVVSHYDRDHIGGVEQVLSRYPVQKNSLDRGTNASQPLFIKYLDIVGNKRKTAFEGSSVTLDASSNQPVTLSFIARDGHGVENVNNENDKSLVFVLHYGQFDALFGGDISGRTFDDYHDVESSVADDIGQIEVYKVNHHGSRNNSNQKFVSEIKPKIGVISCGDGNNPGHPDLEAIERLHNVGTTNYWTETGNGAQPIPGLDKVGGNIIVTVPSHSTTFTVTYSSNHIDTYEVWNPKPTQAFAWSVKSSSYHYADCAYVQSINAENLRTGTEPPVGKKLHVGCPRK